MIDTLTKPETKFELAPMYYITSISSRRKGTHIFTNKGSQPFKVDSWSLSFDDALVLTEDEANEWLRTLRILFKEVYRTKHIGKIPPTVDKHKIT